MAQLIEGKPDELLPRLLPSLYRFDSPGVVSWAEQGLDLAVTTGDDELRRWSAYALGRSPQPEGAPLLRSILDDEDPWIRGWAARGLGRVGDKYDLERLQPLLDDTAKESGEGPVIQALRTGKRLMDAGEGLTARRLARSSAASAGRPQARRASNRHRGVRRVAAGRRPGGQAAGAGARLASSRERELALLALAEGEDGRALVLLPQASTDPEPSLRTASVRAAGLLGEVELIARQLLDDSPQVRRAAIDTLLAAEPPDPSELLQRALADPDVTVRSLALDWGGDRGVFDLATLRVAWEDARRDRLDDARLEVVRALAVLALAAEPAEGDPNLNARRDWRPVAPPPSSSCSSSPAKVAARSTGWCGARPSRRCGRPAYRRPRSGLSTRVSPSRTIVTS